MFKKSLPVLLLPLLLAGCASQLTNLTPQQQHRNANNLYPVEVSFNTRQETVRWQSIRPQIVVGSEFYPMRATPLMTNRWRACCPCPRERAGSVTTTSSTSNTTRWASPATTRPSRTSTSCISWSNSRRLFRPSAEDLAESSPGQQAQPNRCAGDRRRDGRQHGQHRGERQGAGLGNRS